MYLKKGDLIRNKEGILAEVTQDGYTFRFMDAEDREMVAHGMGHMAGSYGTAYNATFITGPNIGRTIRVRARKSQWKKVASQENSEVSVG